MRREERSAARAGDGQHKIGRKRAPRNDLGMSVRGVRAVAERAPGEALRRTTG